MTEQLLTAREIAERLKMDVAHVYKLIAREMRHHRVGSAVRVTLLDYEAWLASKRVEAKGSAPRLARTDLPKRANRKTGQGNGVRPSQFARRAS